MNKNYKYHPVIIFAFLISLIAFSSCKTNKNITYFKDLPDSVKALSAITLSSAEFNNPIIQTDDILSISIQTIDPLSSSIISSSFAAPTVGTASTPSATQQITGFLVDKEGNVEIPLLGKVQLAGLTTSQAREVIRKHASVFFKDPSVQVRYANFKVTLIGEVARPATYTLPNEKVSILDAIGMAGDLTIYGKRENVLLIRDINGQKRFERFNLNSSNIFKSPYYYLKQNDVIYIEPNDAKITSTDAVRTRDITIAASLFSALLVILIRVIK